MKSTGMVSFEKASIPFLTPASTIRQVSPMNMVWQMSGAQSREMKFPNICFTPSGELPLKSRANAFSMNSKDQPPTTL